MTKNQNKIYGSINSSGKKNGQPIYNRLRIRKEYWDRFNKIDEITIKYRRSFFRAKLDNRLFRNYGEIDNDKISRWFGGDNHLEVSIKITNLNNIEIL